MFSFRPNVVDDVDAEHDDVMRTWDGFPIRVRSGKGFLETDRTFGDFVFQIDAATHSKELNSGFFFRAQPGTAAAQSNGYEVQIHNTVVDGDRTKPKDSGTGALYNRLVARVLAADDLQWTSLTLVASGPHFATWVNGYPVVVWRDARPADANPRKGLRLEAGHISLQGHDPTTDVSFRRARIAPFQ